MWIRAYAGGANPKVVNLGELPAAQSYFLERSATNFCLVLPERYDPDLVGGLTLTYRVPVRKRRVESWQRPRKK